MYTNASYPEVISVKTWGATGNGTTDDTAAIQRAINFAVNAGGGVVFFSPGTYMISSQLQVTKTYNVILRGAGPALSIIKCSSTFSGGVPLTTAYLDYINASSNFDVSETITGGTSGATAVISSYSNSGSQAGWMRFGTAVLTSITGTFQAGETITGGTSGVTATTDHTIYPGVSAASYAMIQFKECGYSGVEDLWLQGNSTLAYRPGCYISSLRNTADPLGGGYVPTRNKFSRLWLAGASSGSAWYGVMYNYLAGDSNNDIGHFEDVDVNNVTQACFVFSGSQSRGHVLIDCNAVAARYAICDVNGTYSGDFRWYGGSASQLTSWAFNISSAFGQDIIEGLICENNYRTLAHASGSIHEVVVNSCEFYTESGAADGYQFFLAQGSMTTLDKCRIGEGSESPNPQVLLFNQTHSPPDSASNIPTTFRMVDCHFDAFTSYEADPIIVRGSQPIVITRHGNIGNNDNSSAALPGESPVQNYAYIVETPASNIFPIEAYHGGVFEVTPSSNANFTVDDPQSMPGNPVAITPEGTTSPTHINHISGRQITVRIKNTTGGSLGTVTWGQVSYYKLSSWTQPANGYNRAITFVWDGNYWYEISRTPNDVPN